LAPAKQAIRRTSLRYCLTDWGGKKEPAITFLFHQNIKKDLPIFYAATILAFTYFLYIYLIFFYIF